GNINGRIWSSGTQRGLRSPGGTLGLYPVPPKAGVTSYPYPPGTVVVLWSDGLTSRVDLAANANLISHDPGLIAAGLHRDHSRERADATVVVVANPGTA